MFFLKKIGAEVVSWKYDVDFDKGKCNYALLIVAKKCSILLCFKTLEMHCFLFQKQNNSRYLFHSEFLLILF